VFPIEPFLTNLGDSQIGDQRIIMQDMLTMIDQFFQPEGMSQIGSSLYRLKAISSGHDLLDLTVETFRDV